MRVAAALFRPFVFVLAALCSAVPVVAAEVAVAGVFGNKAVLVVDGGAPRTMSVGQRTPEGVRLIGVEGETAVVEVDGVQERITLGERVVQHATPASDGLLIEGDTRGHFMASGQINGASARFLVDTGASLVSFGRSDALRFGIDLRKATEGRSNTAGGLRRIWLVKLDTVKVGDLVLNNVDGAVHENDLPFVLLGMSFLNRMEMSREGSRLQLRKRF